MPTPDSNMARRIDDLRRAIAASPTPSLPQLLNLAMTLEDAGFLPEALTAYQRAAERFPNSPEVHTNYSSALRTAGRFEDAARHADRAVQLAPQLSEPLSNLGNALEDLQRFNEAVVAYRRAIALRPDFALAHYNLAHALHALRDIAGARAAIATAIQLQPAMPEAHHLSALIAIDESNPAAAIASIKTSLQLRPHAPQAWHLLGTLLHSAQLLDEAIAAYSNAVAQDGTLSDAFNNLGNCLATRGRLSESVAAFSRAIELSAAVPEPHNNLSNALSRLSQFDAAIAAAHRAIELQPSYADAHNNLAVALYRQGALTDAAAAAQRAIASRPDFIDARINLAAILQTQGQIPQAIAELRTTLQLQPHAGAHSNLLYALHLDPDAAPQQIFQEHLDYARIHAASPVPQHDIAPRAGNRNRRLRIGYVSPDFRAHSVNFFIEPILAHHDHTRFEVFCYSDQLNSDAATTRLRTLADHFVDITGLSDDHVAQIIREHRIDILIDLAGHTGYNRLPVFARKPAPLQVTYLGYPDTTGLRAIDYRFTDALADPPSSLATEKLLRLPTTAWCYKPPENAPNVSPLPALSNGYITFGSFNILAKLNPRVIATWSQILQRIPHSRLLIKATALSDPPAAQRLRGAFGLLADRIDILPPDPSYLDHLNRYSQVDIALDPFPYAGTTTTCEALYMGVPVLTLAGANHASRVGVSLLSTVGLPQFISASPDICISTAATLACDVPSLSALRSTLRQRMLASSLCDGQTFTRNFEQALHNIWCDG